MDLEGERRIIEGIWRERGGSLRGSGGRGGLLRGSGGRGEGH